VSGVAQTIVADLTWTGTALEPNIAVAVDAGGKITRVGPATGASHTRLPGRALFPGMVNAHSHAFQRGLRGYGETFPKGKGSFWTWREAMYGLVERLDADRLRTLCVQAFREMRDAGITAVGEFHYIHHLDPAALDFTLDGVVLDAAREVGIRLVLLETYYRTGGIGQPLGPGQRRFATPDLSTYWRQIDRLAAALEPSRESLGVVAHSIRAAEPVEIGELRREAQARRLPFHMHVEEQRREIDECVAAYGAPPMHVILEALDGAAHVTAVHCTHTAPDDMARYLAAGGRVCACPLTEGNLGDGITNHAAQPEAGFRLALGSDSNARIDMLEEMRWLEYGQRLRAESRGMLADAEGSVARGLFGVATEGGAEALSLPAGRIAAGAWADFFTVDLAAPAIAETPPERLLDAVIFGADSSAIAATCVGGRWRSRAVTSDKEL